MQAILAKIGIYAVAALLVFSGGFYAGMRWELPAVQKAQLALANQVTADEKANAAAAVTANKDLMAQGAVNDNVVAAHQGVVGGLESTLGDQRAAIATAAAQTGQDGPVAPVLADALAKIAAAQGGQK
jgi:hypothetical protein